MVKQRNEAIYEQYKKIWREKPHLSYDEVISEVLESPQPRMWLSFWCVYRTLLAIIKGQKGATKRESRKGQESEIWAKYERLKRQPIFRNASVYLLSAFIIAEPSRGFYISHIHAKRIIWRTCRARRNKKES